MLKLLRKQQLKLVLIKLKKQITLCQKFYTIVVQKYFQHLALILLMKLNLSTKNEGLRLLTVLFSDSAKIYETECFIDIYTSIDIMPWLDKHIFLLYSYNFYDDYIKGLLRNNKYFLYEYTVCFEKKMYYLFVFRVNNVDSFSNMKLIGSRLISKKQFLDIFITWKEYLDKDFYELYNVDKCENVLKMKGAVYFQISAFLFILLEFASYSSYVYLVSH